MRCWARRSAARSPTSAITNGAPQLARHGVCRRASLSDGSSEQAFATIATSKCRIIRNCWAPPLPLLRQHLASSRSSFAQGQRFHAANGVLARQNKRCSDVRMARERHLGPRGKNAHASSVRGIVRRQDKGCLSKIERIGDGLQSARPKGHAHRESPPAGCRRTADP
jgi:hypothetical protein